MQQKTTTISGWGNYPSLTCQLLRPERYQDLQLYQVPGIARGNGRSYGDAAITADGNVILTERLNRILAFDKEKGLITAEAGISLADILSVVVRAGWFLAVTPGTRFATLGGCVAADVHGKNHHQVGSFGQYVTELELILADNRIVTCSPEQHAELFWATIGGMGLTGIIGTVTLQLMPLSTSKMLVQHYVAKTFDELFAYLQDPTIDAAYSIAWIDCISSGDKLGRGVLMIGNHAQVEDLPAEQRQHPLQLTQRKLRHIPGRYLSCLLNPITMRAFNHVYYLWQQRKQHIFLDDYDSYFYPLDVLAGWNDLYGKTGFVQYQCVIPTEVVQTGIKTILHKITATGVTPFLGSLKRFGASSPGLLSFPMPGYTLALDMSLRNAKVLPLLQDLDAMVADYGGRVYLAKDACLTADIFRRMYPRYSQWLQIKKQYDPHSYFRSSLSRRLGLG